MLLGDSVNPKPKAPQTSDKASVPLAKPAKKAEITKPKPSTAVVEDVSAFSISGWLHKKEEKKEKTAEYEEKLPADHFSQVNIDEEWSGYLQELHGKDPVKFSAVQACTLTKSTENEVIVGVPSEVAQSEFKSIQREFLSIFERKVNNFHIKFRFKQDLSLKKEILTKKKIFDKFAKINPVLKELDDLMKFDFL